MLVSLKTELLNNDHTFMVILRTGEKQIADHDAEWGYQKRSCRRTSETSETDKVVGLSAATQLISGCDYKKKLSVRLIWA